MHKSVAVIALGSNLGESAATLAAAAKRIAACAEIDLVALSSIYTSKPAVVAEQPDFMNAVMMVETSLSPFELLGTLQGIEAEFGRLRGGKGYVPSGPRTLDLDLIDMEGVVCSELRLTLPHPEALRRAFVVTPLLEISPYHVLANHKVVNANAVDCGDLIAINGQPLVSDAPVPLSEGSTDGLSESYVKGLPEGVSESSPESLQKDSPEGLSEALSKKSKKPHEEASDQTPLNYTVVMKNGPCLYVCATPIGNLGDITVRVLETLHAVDIIYCEDTRVTHKLTNRYSIDTPLRRADAHKLPLLLPSILSKLEEGLSLAYVSDAGMPGISDPGSILVATVREAGYPVEILPGASALTTALATSGIKAQSHYFGGFFPRKTGAGTRLLEGLDKLGGLSDTALVFFESVHRTAKTIALIAEVLPARQVIMARELTKLHEEVVIGTAAELSLLLAKRTENGRTLKGEVVLIIAPSSSTTPSSIASSSQTTSQLPM